MPKIDVPSAAPVVGTLYPPPYDEPCLRRERRKLGDLAGLTQFGVNLLRLPPGAWSAQRHWHEGEDEFVWVVQGEVVLVTDAAEEVLRAGDCAGFKAGEPVGHHLQNRSDREALVLEVGTRSSEDVCDYPGIDMRATKEGYFHRDGAPYPKTARRSA